MSFVRCDQCGRWLTEDERVRPCPRCGGLGREVLERDSAVAADKAVVARALAERHYLAESGLRSIFRLTGSAEAEAAPDEPIKLLEINADTIPSGVLPVAFGPSPAQGVPYPSVIVEVSPEEFRKIQTQELKLPRGWRLEEEFPKPADARSGD